MSHPPARARQIAVYFKLNSAKMVLDFKAKDAVFYLLNAHRAWLLVDSFQSESTGCAGTIMNRHPTLTWTSNLKQQIVNAMRDVVTDGSTDQLILEAFRGEAQGGDTYVPKFEIVKKQVGFGIADGRVVTRTLKVHVQMELDSYTKEVMSAASDQNPELGLFVPAGYFKIAGVNSYKQLLSGQNKFMMEMRAIPIVGLKVEAADALVQVQTQEGVKPKQFDSSWQTLDCSLGLSNLRGRVTWESTFFPRQKTLFSK